MQITIHTRNNGVKIYTLEINNKPVYQSSNASLVIDKQIELNNFNRAGDTLPLNSGDIAVEQAQQEVAPIIDKIFNLGKNKIN